MFDVERVMSLLTITEKMGALFPNLNGIRAAATQELQEIDAEVMQMIEDERAPRQPLNDPAQLVGLDPETGVPLRQGVGQIQPEGVEVPPTPAIPGEPVAEVPPAGPGEAAGAEGRQQSELAEPEGGKTEPPRQPDKSVEPNPADTQSSPRRI